MLDYKVKIGIAPVRRIMGDKVNGPWNHASAKKAKDYLVPYIIKNFSLDKVEFIDLEWFNDEGLMFEYNHALPISKKFRQEEIDGLFIINCNFGEEEVAAKLAQLMNVPTLIWAPLDTGLGADGVRMTDSQCGLFATSKLMQRMGITFSHIENCLVEDELFASEFKDFLAVTCMMKNWKTMRILQLGVRPKPFTSMIYNESELMEKFGIEIMPYTTALAVQKFEEIWKTKQDVLKADVALLKKRYKLGEGVTEELMLRSSCVTELYRELIDETECSFLCAETGFQWLTSMGTGSNLAIGVINSEKRVVPYETDMLGGITMCLLDCATMGGEYPYFGEFTIRHPSNKNAELIWHGGNFPYETADPSIHEPYISANGTRMSSNFEVGRGTATIARLDAIGGKYSMLLGTYEGVEGPFTTGTYVWGEFKDWSKWEKATIYGPYVHHMAEIRTDVVRRVKEFCRYAGITADCPDER